MKRGNSPVTLPVTFISSPDQSQEVEIYESLRDLTDDSSGYPIFRTADIFAWNIHKWSIQGDKNSRESYTGKLLADIFEDKPDDRRILVPTELVTMAVKTFFARHAERKAWSHVFLVGAPHAPDQADAILKCFPDCGLLYIAPRPESSSDDIQRSIVKAAERFQNCCAHSFVETRCGVSPKVKLDQVLELAGIDADVREQWFRQTQGVADTAYEESSTDDQTLMSYLNQ